MQLHSLRSALTAQRFVCDCHTNGAKRSINNKEQRKIVNEMKKIRSAAFGVPEYDMNR
jgi:hypothetical protein